MIRTKSLLTVNLSKEKINLQDDHLSEYNEDSDLKDLIGDTSLFPEIFSDTNCTLFGKGYEFL